MKSITMPSFLLLLFSLVAIPIGLVAKNLTAEEGDPNLGFISSLCGHHHDEDPPKMEDRAEELTDVAVSFGYPGGIGFCATQHGSPHIYAYSWCSAAISTDECHYCLAFARSQLLDVYCKGLYGAQLTLAGCFMRYETYKFCDA